MTLLKVTPTASLAKRPTFTLDHSVGADQINVGTGRDITIKEFATYVANVVGYEGKIVFDRTRPDGMPQKLLDVSKLTRLGWQAKTSLRDGLAHTYQDFVATGGVRQN